jgi:hypothetical protein
MRVIVFLSFVYTSIRLSFKQVIFIQIYMCISLIIFEYLLKSIKLRYSSFFKEKLFFFKTINSNLTDDGVTLFKCLNLLKSVILLVKEKKMPNLKKKLIFQGSNLLLIQRTNFNSSYIILMQFELAAANH